jgi:hypothetical protein
MFMVLRGIYERAVLIKRIRYLGVRIIKTSTLVLIYGVYWLARISGIQGAGACGEKGGGDGPAVPLNYYRTIGRDLDPTI